MTNDEKIAAIREVLRDYINTTDIPTDIFLEAICDIVGVDGLYERKSDQYGKSN